MSHSSRRAEGRRILQTRTATLALVAWFAALCVALCAAHADRPWLDPDDPSVTVALATADSQFAWYGGPGSQQQWLQNYGAARQTRMKGYQDVTALQFDLAGRRGQLVEEAEVWLARADDLPIFAMVAATINTDWTEGRGSGSPAQPGESCWRWRRTPEDPDNPGPDAHWTFPWSDFSTASFGAYGSLVCYATQAGGTFSTIEADGLTWIRMRLDVDLVHALMLDQHGLVVTDSRGYDGNYNPRVHAREAGADRAPRLLLRFAEAEPAGPAPDALQALTAEPGPSDGEVLLAWSAPKGGGSERAFSYRFTVADGDDPDSAAIEVERWRIPRPEAPGQAQRLLLEGLTPGRTYRFTAWARNRLGAASAPAVTTLVLPPAAPAPRLDEAARLFEATETPALRALDGRMTYWAASELARIDPRTGADGNRPLDGVGEGRDDPAGPVWDAAANRIALIACRNEMVGVQLIVGRLGETLTGLTVRASDLTGPQGRIAADPNIEWFRLGYIAHEDDRLGDVALPLQAPFAETVSIPDGTFNPDGVYQALWQDLYVPRDAAPGLYTGVITLSADGWDSPTTLGLRLRVSPVRLPDALSFVIDLNGYGAVWGYGDADLNRLRHYQLAHKHRASLNTLPYGWSGNVNVGRAPTLTGSGADLRTADWSRFDTEYGPLFDGSAFRPDHPVSPYVGPGEGTPVATFYTPFHESWPIALRDPDHGFDADGKGGAWWDDLVDSDSDAFWATAPDVTEGFPESYRQGVRAVLADWTTHARDRGWTATNFQIYLNNKYYYDGSAALWALEECLTADDFRAVGWFHDLYRQGVADGGAPEVRWHFRIDISDKWGQHYGALDNLVNWVVMGAPAARWHWPNLRYRNILLREPEQWTWYGDGPAPWDSGAGLARGLLQAWAQGLDGGVPYWDCFQTDWNEAQTLSVVYSGRQVPGHGPYDGPLASVRLKTMRQAQQIVELANLLADRPGWSREKARQAVLDRSGDGSWNHAFSALDGAGVHALRADLMATLEATRRRAGRQGR